MIHYFLLFLCKQRSAVYKRCQKAHIKMDRVLSKMPNSFRQLLKQFNNIIVSPLQRKNLNRTIFITVSISTICLCYCIQLLFNRSKRVTRHLINMIPELQRPNIKMSNPDHVEFLLSNMINMGKEKLQVVSDFDRTITPVSSPTSNALLEKSEFVSANLRKEFQELRNHYLPIELDEKMSKEEKIPYMVDWWTNSLRLTIQTQVSPASIKNIVQNSTTSLKEGCKWFFYILERYEVPLLIFSAGLGDIIKEWISKEAGFYKNLKVISNFMDFDSQTKQITGFKGKMIHVFNKNEGVLMDTKYENQIKSRPNVILLGDSLGDVDMTVGLGSINNVLKIGFLNDKMNKLLPVYMKAYDIVIIEDNTFEIPNAILRSIF